MDSWLRRAFQTHLREQCRFFTLALEDIETGDAGVVPYQDRGSDRLWYGVQNAILAAANISKILWGPQRKGGGWPKGDERKPLRDFLGVVEPSVLKSKDMRHHLEHIDERIDKWFDWAAGEGMPIPTRSDRTVATLDPGWQGKSQFRWFNIDTLTLYFRDDTYDLHEVALEVERISLILEKELASPWFS